MHKMKQDFLNVVFNHEENQVFNNFHYHFFWLENKALVILLKSDPTILGSYLMVFKRCFEKNIEE